MFSKTYAAFRTDNASLIPQEMQEVYICDALKISHTELLEQPQEWIDLYVTFLSAKSKAENDLMKEKK